MTDLQMNASVAAVGPGEGLGNSHQEGASEQQARESTPTMQQQQTIGPNNSSETAVTGQQQGSQPSEVRSASHQRPWEFVPSRLLQC